MSKKKLLQQLSNFLDMGNKKRSKYAKELKKLLKELKVKEKELIEKCSITPSNNKRKMLNREIVVIHAKRKKGLDALKKINKE
jgi:hypothetical protein